MTNNEIAIAATSKVCGISKKTILSASRKWPAVEARMLIVLLLCREGLSDETISWVLNRKRGAILKARHNGHANLRYSKSFKEKFDKIQGIYVKQKSLRVS